MTDLEFTVVDIFPEHYAAAPQLTVRLRIEECSGAVVHAMALRCQVKIEAQRRSYSAEDELGLLDLFGWRDRWQDTLRPFLWMQAQALVQGFTGVTEVDLALPCTYDFDVTGSKYLHALRDGVVPVRLLFTGTVFTKGITGFGVEQVPWDREAAYDLPVAAWREMMDQYFPSTGWLRLDHDTMRELAHFRATQGLTTWEETFAALLQRSGLSASGEGVP
ncbi:MAG: DUF6084 family protein [Actinomycetota bacterium]|nr:DUF6084 family protein [Actinomycetota bacterium]